MQLDEEDRSAVGATIETGTEPQSGSWSSRVGRVQARDEPAAEDLYRVLERGVRFQLCRNLGTDELDDRVHDVILTVIPAIRRGELREPERLMGFVHTILRRRIAT